MNWFSGSNKYLAVLTIMNNEEKLLNFKHLRLNQLKCGRHGFHIVQFIKHTIRFNFIYIDKNSTKSVRFNISPSRSFSISTASLLRRNYNNFDSLLIYERKKRSHRKIIFTCSNIRSSLILMNLVASKMMNSQELNTMSPTSLGKWWIPRCSMVPNWVEHTETTLSQR